MRRNGYLLFEIVAWPAAAGGVLECLLRVVIGDLAGIGGTIALTACAAATIAAARWRSRTLTGNVDR